MPFSLSSPATAAARRLTQPPSCAGQVLRTESSARTHSSFVTSRSIQRRFSTHQIRSTQHSFAAKCNSHAIAPPAATRRCFHSYDHPNEPPVQDSFSAAEQAILTAASRHIPTHGFVERTLALGAYDAGYPGISTSILPDGVFSLVRWHLVNQRLGLAASSRGILREPAAGVALAPSEIASRAERLIWERLMGNREIVGRWQEVRSRNPV